MADLNGSTLRRRNPPRSTTPYVRKETALDQDKNIHKPAESLLTETFGLSGFSGFNIWLILLLSSAGLCLLLENLRSELRINPHLWIYYLTGSEAGFERLFIYMALYSCAPAVLCLFVERSIAEKQISPTIGMIAHILNISQILILPPLVLYSNASTFSAMGSAYTIVIYLAQFFKLWSYVQVNYWCRLSQNSASSQIKQMDSNSSLKKGSLVHYPANLTFKDMAYFFFAPTLCYELNFPRTNGMRKRFMLKCLLEVIFFLLFGLCLCEQWLVQATRNALNTLINEDDILKSIEYNLRLTIPAFLVWLIWFYSFFHSFLNLWAELMYFADRTFYHDWWNSTRTQIFWTRWNVVVHRWALRHIYFPVIESGYSRNVAVYAVFFVSALLHEYMFSIPLKIIEFQTFFGMLVQVPIMSLSSWVEKRFGPKCGACFVAGLFILSTYKLVLTYYHKYLITHNGEAIFESYFSN